jgi:hypothetical protein
MSAVTAWLCRSTVARSTRMSGGGKLQSGPGRPPGADDPGCPWATNSQSAPRCSNSQRVCSRWQCNASAVTTRPANFSTTRAGCSQVIHTAPSTVVAIERHTHPVHSGPLAQPCERRHDAHLQAGKDCWLTSSNAPGKRRTILELRVSVSTRQTPFLRIRRSCRSPPPCGSLDRLTIMHCADSGLC